MLHNAYNVVLEFQIHGLNVYGLNFYIYVLFSNMSE